MKCILMSTYDDIYSDPLGYREDYIKEFTQVKAFKSKKDILIYLNKNLRDDDGKKFNFKNIKSFLKEYNHCFRIYPYYYLDCVVEKFSVLPDDIDLKEIKNDRKTNN